MKKLIFFFLCAFMCTSCNNNLLDNDGSQDGKINTTSQVCEQMKDPDIHLYPFIPFTDKEMEILSYIEKSAKRQIPANFLSKMTTKALFYQFISCELSPRIFLSDFSAQAGFLAMKKDLNMLPELLNRSDAGKVLMELMKNTDLSKLDGIECFHFYLCLERIFVQPEVINKMTDGETDQFLQLAENVRDTIIRLSETDSNWSNPESLTAIMFGLGNVMLKYNYEPFMLLLNSNQGVEGLMTGSNLRSFQIVLLINNCINDFVKQKNQ